MDIKQKPKGNRPPAPPKQNKNDLENLYVDAIKLIDQLEQEKKSIIELDNRILKHRNQVIEHLEKTIKDASVFLIDRSESDDEPIQLSYNEMKELYELLVDAIGFNDGTYFND